MRVIEARDNGLMNCPICIEGKIELRLSLSHAKTHAKGERERGYKTLKADYQALGARSLIGVYERKLTGAQTLVFVFTYSGK